MTDVAEELRAYAARRMGGTSPRAQQLVGRAATLYGQTLRLLQRHGGSSAKFWESLDMLSMSFDDIMNSFPGDADYYLGPRQFDELVRRRSSVVLPALRAMAPGVARRPLPQQLTVVGDLVIHTHCEALSAAQQRDGVAQLCRVVAAAKHDPESRPHYTTMRFCLVTAVAKVWLLFMSTAREQQPPHASDLDREYDGALAAAAARGGMLKAALLLLADTRSMALAMGVVPEMVAASEALSVGVPELEENNLHILDAAAKFAGALVEVGETPAAAALGKWAAGKPAVVSMLLQKLRLPPVEPRCYPVIARTVLLVSRLAAVAPALRAALNAAGLRQALERLRSAWSVAGYTVDSEAAGRCLQALCSDALDGQGAAAQPGLGQQARQARQQNGSAAAPTREQLAALPVRELRARLQAAGLDTTGCAESS
ncbi:molybdenum cofactor biosysnthesis [Micractinium conductrix]|uniref:Molybdenum cofactor biosysnthesis n=1 Tax=Micractinium conductrix TaxID=554055 RepID=A0A2P6VB75_9CHLO|nr:molybdenum cofactor biosysnthesis [Micractinium conductrix]|eukprot:PSC71339.1 molybdenum cofactor biosysnthesis [Micractinium conductrix]